MGTVGDQNAMDPIRARRALQRVSDLDATAVKRLAVLTASNPLTGSTASSSMLTAQVPSNLLNKLSLITVKGWFTATVASNALTIGLLIGGFVVVAPVNGLALTANDKFYVECDILVTGSGVALICWKSMHKAGIIDVSDASLAVTINANPLIGFACQWTTNNSDSIVQDLLVIER
jgi:hypothetical protein